MDDSSAGGRLPPIANIITRRQDRLPTLSETLRSGSQFSPYPVPRPPRRPSIRPASRGQAAATRLTPSSPLAHSFNTEVATDVRTSHDPIASHHFDEDTEDESAEEEDSMNETPPEEDSALCLRPNSEHVMLSPPLSPPSPAPPSTHAKDNAPDTLLNSMETSGRSAADDERLSESLDEYIGKFTQDDILGKPRFDEVLQEIWRLSGVWMDPKQLKRVVLLNRRQRLLDQWKDDPVETSDEVLVPYQRRLMVHDIDNQLRLLDVPS